jgi:hypothetical protein
MEKSNQKTEFKGEYLKISEIDDMAQLFLR